MTPVFNVQTALADEPADRPATTGGDVSLEGPAENTGLPAEGENQPTTATVREDGALIAEGLIYKSEGNGATLIGFEDGASLGREISIPEKLTDGVFEYTVKGVSVAEGQTAPNVLSLELPQTIEDVDTKSLAAAMPALARVSVDGRGGDWSSANGILFKQESVTASSDGSTTRIANRELVWAPPAMVIARIPGTCKAVAPGAFTDDRALETVMVFSIVESVARAEKDGEGNITKEGAFTDEQVSKVNIVTPMETLVYPDGDRVSADAFLAQDEPLNEKHIPWCDCGFDMDRFTVGIPYGSTSLAVAVPEDGRVGTPEITVGHYTDHPEWDPKGETGEPENGLVFEYKADMTVSVSWKGDKTAIPSHLELPAYVIENGVKTAVTEVAPSAFEGAAQLESVVVPEGITTVGESAFAGCSNLKDASLPSTLGATGDTVFDGCGISGSVASFDSDDSGSVSAELGLGQPKAAFGSGESSSLVPYNLIDSSQTSLEVFVYPEAYNIDFDKSTISTSATSGWLVYLSFPDKANIIDLVAARCVGDRVELFLDCSLNSVVTQRQATLVPKPGWKFASFTPGARSRFNIFMVPTSIFNADSHIDKNVADLANYYNKTAADGRYQPKGSYATTSTTDGLAGRVKALEGKTHLALGDTATTAARGDHKHDSLYAKLEEFKALKTKVDSKADSSLLSKSGEAAFTATSTVRGAINSVSSVANGAKSTADANKTDIGKLGTRVTALENRKGLELGDTATTAARGNHDHDGTYAKQGDLAALNKTVDGLKTGKADASKVTALETDVTNLKTAVGGKADASSVYTKGESDGRYVAASEFGSVSYEGMEGVASKAVMPTAYRAGGTPSLHEPERDGYEFAGWSWSRANADGSRESGDGTNLAYAFSEAGGVTLTAEWERAVPEATHFFTGDAPLRAGDASEFQSSVIKVRLSDEAGRLERVGFARDDVTGLLKDGAAIALWVGSDPDVTAEGKGTRLDLAGDGAATSSGWSLELAELGPDSWGVYVGVRVKTSDVNESPVESFTEGSYVASLVKMSYRFA